MEHLSEDKINAWVDNSLSMQERKQVETHLASCPSCKKLAADIIEICAALDSLPPAPAQKRLAKQTMAAFSKEVYKDKPITPWPRWNIGWASLAYATVAIGIGLGVFLGQAAQSYVLPSEAGSQYVSYLTTETVPEVYDFTGNLVSDNGGEK